MTKQKHPTIHPRKPMFPKTSNDAERRKSTKGLLDLADVIPNGRGLPRDLSDKHSYYAAAKPHTEINERQIEDFKAELSVCLVFIEDIDDRLKRLKKLVSHRLAALEKDTKTVE